MDKEKNSNNDIDSLIISYFNGEISDPEIELLKQWMKDTSENRMKFNEMRISWMASAQLKESDDEVQKALSEINSKIKHKQEVISKKYSIIRLLRVAAVLILTVSFSSLITYIVTIKKPDTLNNNEICVYAPLGSKAMTVMPDGTEVWLNAGSKLKYISGTYGKTYREVILEGEGFFKVVSNASKPFIVQAKNIRVKALGTEFNVKAYAEEDEVETTLVKGKVKVEGEYGTGKSVSVFLKPNQQIILDTKEPEEMKGNDIIDLTRTDLYTSWKDYSWIIKGETIEDLATLLERRFNIDIIFNSEELKNYKFTGTFQNETIEQVLQVLVMTLPLNYKLEKGKVTLALDSVLKQKYKKYTGKIN